MEFAEKPSIVYVSTHKNAESIAADLQQIGVDALFYHGGLKAKQREEIQASHRGEVQVIVATNAFGMGVDKPDIRFVFFHFDVSDSLDGYYQEIGRAGRDGQEAEAVLFYRPQDISAQQFKTGASHVDSEGLEAVYRVLTAMKGPMTREEISIETNIPPRKLVGLLHQLHETGATRHLETGEIEAATTEPLSQVIEAAAERQKVHKELRKQRLQKMQCYAEWRSCRRQYLLRYFGDDYAGPCGNCDRCEERASSPGPA